VVDSRRLQPTDVTPGDVSATMVGVAENPTRSVALHGLVVLDCHLADTFISTYFFYRQDMWLPKGLCSAAALTITLTPRTSDGNCVCGCAIVAGYSRGISERPSSPPARYVHGNNTLEIVWTVLTAVLFIG